MEQLLASVAALHCNISSVNTFVGGTETTAINHWAVKALRRIGFKFAKPTSG